MENRLIAPSEILTVIPGRVVCEGTVGSKLKNQLSMRSYRYDKMEVYIPEMRDYMLVRWVAPPEKLGFFNSGRWEGYCVRNDNVTLLARGDSSRWFWTDDIQASHVYVPESSLKTVASELFEKDVESLNINHRAVSQDATLAELMKAYERECMGGGLGGQLFADTIETQICIHLIREYSQCKLREIHVDRSMSDLKQKLIREYVSANLDRCIRIEDLAGISGVSKSYFIRLFRNAFRMPPHAYILQQRLEKAKVMLESPLDIPIKVIAIDCGFSDQSHLTRVFKSTFSITPNKYRAKIRVSGFY
ncbi:helix-turn-helix transcriptional regulator [Pseudomonas kurunegalensis]|uniref:helix-turn-helix transcriptional regulator n=1 Tax=Pseudomonas kurunegalensis TaxID=485880 RepID=UPI003260C1DE